MDDRPRCTQDLSETLASVELRARCCKSAGHDGQHIAGSGKLSRTVYLIQGQDGSFMVAWE